jgi:hypothetical protein
MSQLARYDYDCTSCPSNVAVLSSFAIGLALQLILTTAIGYALSSFGGYGVDIIEKGNATNNAKGDDYYTIAHKAWSDFLYLKTDTKGEGIVMKMIRNLNNVVGLGLTDERLNVLQTKI